MSKKLRSVQPLGPYQGVSANDWMDWRWQLRNALKNVDDFSAAFELSEAEREGLKQSESLFKVAVTPYYASLARPAVELDPIRRIFMPRREEALQGQQQMLDPLGEKKNQPVARVIHRYSDRVLFWVTDTCGVYCRYCTRKHFTAKGHASPSVDEHKEAIEYIRKNKAIREVILSGGDPLTLSDQSLLHVLNDLRSIDHVEIIRIGTRMPVVNPMRITQELVQVLKSANPVFVMTHFNHPREVTKEAYQALTSLVDSGLPVMNQMVLLNGVNNHAAVVQALSRRLMLARVKPYYMFQCDPSEGTDHLRTSVEDSLSIQRELWGHLSGLALPTLSLDIPDGGGKTYLVPNFEVERAGLKRTYVGWDGVRSDYISPDPGKIIKPLDVEEYTEEWMQIKSARN